MCPQERLTSKRALLWKNTRSPSSYEMYPDGMHRGGASFKPLRAWGCIIAAIAQRHPRRSASPRYTSFYACPKPIYHSDFDQCVLRRWVLFMVQKLILANSRELCLIPSILPRFPNPRQGASPNPICAIPSPPRFPTADRPPNSPRAKHKKKSLSRFTPSTYAPNTRNTAPIYNRGCFRRP
jgi:hypothetical protein